MNKDQVRNIARKSGILLITGPFLICWIIAIWRRNPEARIFGFAVQGMLLVLLFQALLGLRSLFFFIWFGNESVEYAYTSVAITSLYLFLGFLNSAVYFMNKDCLGFIKNNLIDRLLNRPS